MPAAHQATAPIPLDDAPVIGRPVIDVERPKAAEAINTVLAKVAAATQTNPLGIMREYAALAFGPGRVSFNEFIRLRLFDDAYYQGADKREVIGWSRNDRINRQVNFLHEWWALVANKVAHSGYLSAHGFPTIPAIAVYSDHAVGHASGVARDEADLHALLKNSDIYPMFGKPVEGFQSLGSIALKGFHAPSQALETIDGRVIPVGEFVASVVKNYPRGYVFQKFMTPHPSARAVCGHRVTTVRIVTITIDGAPKLFRACWKISVGANLADNFWRPGNLLAQIDTTTGRVTRVISGTGLEVVEHARHPDSGVAFAGLEVPLWPELVRTALEAARLMRDVSMIGWDMAALEAGPTIVELNCTPDLFLNQFADRRGIMDQEFVRFIDQQKRNRKLIARQIRARIAAA